MSCAEPKIQRCLYEADAYPLLPRLETRQSHHFGLGNWTLPNTFRVRYIGGPCARAPSRTDNRLSVPRSSPQSASTPGSNGPLATERVFQHAESQGGKTLILQFQQSRGCCAVNPRAGLAPTLRRHTPRRLLREICGDRRPEGGFLEARLLEDRGPEVHRPGTDIFDRPEGERRG